MSWRRRFYLSFRGKTCSGRLTKRCGLCSIFIFILIGNLCLTFVSHLRLDLDKYVIFNSTVHGIKANNSNITFSQTSEVRHVVFLKVHKAAGTTVMNIIIRFAMNRNLSIMLPRTGNMFSQYNHLVPRKALPSFHDNKKMFDIFCNHVIYKKELISPFFPQDTLYIGIVRQPFEQFVSAFVYYRDLYKVKYLTKIPGKNPIKTYLSDPLRYEAKKIPFSYTNNRMAFDFGFPAINFNNMTKFYKYLDKLENEFNLVMVVDMFDESLVLLKRLLKWSLKDIIYIKRNSLKKSYDFTFSNIDTLIHRKWAKLDYALYDHYKDVLRRKILAAGHNFMDEVHQFKKSLQKVEVFCKQLNTQPKIMLLIEETDFNNQFVIRQSDCELLTMDAIDIISIARKKHTQRLDELGIVYCPENITGHECRQRLPPCRRPAVIVRYSLVLLFVIIILSLFLYFWFADLKTLQYSVASRNSSLNSMKGMMQTETSQVQHIVFLKVHKAAGSTVLTVLMRFALERNLSIMLPRRGNSFSQRSPFIAKKALPSFRANKKYDLLCNHVIFKKELIAKFFPQDTVYIGIVRQPFEQFVSAFIYYRDLYKVKYLTKIPGKNPIKTYLSDPLRYEAKNIPFSYTNNRMAFDFGFPAIDFNNMTKFYKYLDKLDNDLDLVMIVDMFDESLVLLKRLLKWTLKDILYIKKNSHKKSFEFTFSAKDKMVHKKWARLDYALYNHYRSILLSKIVEAGATFHEEVSHFKTVRRQVVVFCKNLALTGESSEYFIGKTQFNPEIYISEHDCKLLNMNSFTMTSIARNEHKSLLLKSSMFPY